MPEHPDDELVVILRDRLDSLHAPTPEDHGLELVEGYVSWLRPIHGPDHPPVRQFRRLDEVAAICPRGEVVEILRALSPEWHSIRIARESFPPGPPFPEVRPGLDHVPDDGLDGCRGILVALAIVVAIVVLGILIWRLS